MVVKIAVKTRRNDKTEPNGDASMALGAPAISLADRRLGTIALMVATGMQAADATIVNVALPQLERDLGGGVVLGAWVMTSYLCATAVLAPLTGWLRRRYGARHLFIAAIAIFVIASLSCALAPSLPALIVFRLVQGAAGGVIHPMTQAILLDLYPQERHGRMLGIWGATTMVGPIAGPLFGGVITDLASWRWAFAISLPLGILALWGMWRILPGAEPTDRQPTDTIGILLLVTGIGAMQLALQRGVGQSWLHSPELIAEALIAVCAAGGMLLRSGNSGLAIIRGDVLRNLGFAAAAFFNFMTSALLFTSLVFIPALAEGPLGYDATLAGATIVPRAVLMMLMMLMVGRLIGRIDFRVLLAIGWGLMTGGLVILSAIRPPDELGWLVAGSTIQAIGAGMMFTPLSTYAFATLPIEMRTDAAGLYSLLRQLGCASGVALMTAVLHAKISTHLAGLATAAAVSGVPPSARLMAGSTLQAYAASFRVMAIAAVVVTPGILLFRASRTEKAAPVGVSPGVE